MKAAAVNGGLVGLSRKPARQRHPCVFWTAITVKTIEHCPLCESDTGDSARLLFESADYISHEVFNVLKCKRCGLIYTDSCPDQESEFRKYYPKEEYYGSEGGKRFISPLEKMVFAFRLARAKRVLNFRTKGCALDIGCGRGLFLRLLKSKGWKCYGTELSEALASFIRDHHEIDVRTSPVENCRFADKMFDLVSIYHVLEHISNPKDTLREARRIIRDDGLLIIGVPNAASFQSLLSGSKWFHLDVPRHAVHFSLHTLRRTVEDCGFEVVSIEGWSAEYDPYGLIQSMLNMLGCRKNLLYQLLRDRSIDGANAKTLLYDVPLSLGLPVLLIIPSVVLELVLARFGLNGTLEIHCRPSSRNAISG